MPQLHAFFDPNTSTFSYVVSCPNTKQCAIIDPVLDYDLVAAKTSTHSASKIVDYIHAEQLTVQWILETHAHADHLSAAAWLKEQLGGQIAIGAPIHVVQKTFKDIYHLPESTPTNGQPFDVLLHNNQRFFLGNIAIDVLHVPGHTPADIAYHVHDLGIFVGDTLFMPDVGSARCDFPGGNAEQLYDSVQQLLAFPDHTALFMCHDYPPQSREPLYQSSVGAQKKSNIHLKAGTTKAEFVAMRTKRDQGLSLPKLMLPALQVNIQAGHLPPAEADGHQYLKIPLNRF